MSIASGLRKKILPKSHQDINAIYKRRLDQYLNLVSIHGENNKNLVNIMYKGEVRDDEKLKKIWRTQIFNDI